MKCPKCGKGIHSQAKTCKYCKTRIIRKSDKMAKKMTVNPLFAMMAGGILVGVGGVLAFYDTLTFAAITALVGVVLLLVGKALK